MANRFVSVDGNYVFPTPLEARLAAKMTASVTDAAVAARINGAATGAAIDSRINTQVSPIVEQLTADYIASDAAVVDAAAAAVDANPTIAGMEKRLGASTVRLSVPATTTETRTAVGVRVPVRLPFNASEFRVHFRNRNPQTGTGFPGSISFSATGISVAQVVDDQPFVASVAAPVAIQGAATLAEGGEYVTPWKADFPLTAGVWYHLSYGVTTAGSEFYAGAGTAWVNATPMSVLNQTMGTPAIGYKVPLDVWIEAVPTGGGTPETVFAGIAPPAAAAAVTVSSRTAVTAFGDSLTDGGSNGELWPESDTWPVKLDSVLPNATVTNLGYSSATVDELLLRIGAMPLRVIVPAGGIPPSGNALVTPTQTYGMPAGTRPIDTTYNGGGVRINKNSDGTWQLYNFGSTTIPAGEALIPPAAAWAGRNGDTAIIWIGVNNNTGNVKGLEETVADHIVAGHQRLVAWLSPQVKQFMILGITTRTPETTGAAANDTVLEVNRRLRGLFPGNFKSIQEYLRTQALTDLGITPTQDDLGKIAAGVLPPSVLASGDVGHISKETATVVATHFVKPYLVAKGWVDG